MLTILSPVFPSHISGILPFFQLSEKSLFMAGLIALGLTPKSFISAHCNGFRAALYFHVRSCRAHPLRLLPQ